MDIKPIISIIIPVFNAGKYLEKCLDSILKQEASKFEILLINDGSLDNSASICDRYASVNSNIKVFHKENGGPSSARNMGLENAQGTYIAFVDSDDYVTEDYIEIVSLHIQKTNPDVIVFAYNHVKNNKISKIENSLNKALSHEEILLLLSNTSSNNFLWYPWNKLYKKSLIDINNITFDLKIKVGEDTLFNLRCFYFSKSILNINHPLYVYVTNENSLTQTPYKKYLNKNMQSHFENRLNFHDTNNAGNNDIYYKDMAQYYIEHVFFLLFHNAANMPNGKFAEELKIIRKLPVFDFLFKYHNYSNNLTLKMKVIIYLFKNKYFNMLSLL